MHTKPNTALAYRLVFWRQLSWQNSNGVTSKWSAKWMCSRKNLL